MKKFNIMLAFVALFTFSSVSANDLNSDDKPETELSKQIYSLLEDNSFDIKSDLVANVRLTFNQDGEIVILSIEANDEVLTSFVKSRLNYTKVDFTDKVEGKVYSLPVKIVATT